MKHKCQFSLLTRLCTLLQVLQVFALFGMFMLVSTPQSVAGVADTTPPQVFPPKDITISHTEPGGARAQDSKSLQDFLADGKARDGVTVTTTANQPSTINANPGTRLTPQVNGVDVTDSTLFPQGTTAVTFRFADAAGNVGIASANVTVLDLEDGDLFVGGKVADNGFGDVAVAGIFRVRGDQATVYCQSGSGDNFWNIPSHVLVDSKGRIAFTAKLGSSFFNTNTGLLRCNGPGAPAEKLAVFRWPGFGPTTGYPDPFPNQSFVEFNGLHLEASNVVTINDASNSGIPQIGGGDSYVFSYGPPGLNTDPAESLRYFPDTGQWLRGPSVGDVGHAGGSGNTPDMAFHDGKTYIAQQDKLLRDKNGLNVSVSGHAGSRDFSATLNLFGGSSEISPELLTAPICGECGLPVHDLNVPPVDSGCQPNPPASSVLATGVFTVGELTYDEYTGHGLVLGTNEVGSGAPFLANLSEALLDNPGDPSQTFTNPGLGCAVEPEVYFQSVLPFFGQKGINGFGPLVSSTHGIVGVAGGGIAVMAPGPDPTDEQFLITNQPIGGGLGAWPPRVSSGMTANAIIRVDSPVNILVTSPDGKKIGVSDAGQPVNDFGNDGFDSGPGEPRFFAINNPSPGAYNLQVIGTGDGPFAVHIYSNDMSVPIGTHIAKTGTASPGSTTAADFDLADDFQVSFTSAGGGSDTTPPTTAVSLSPQPNPAGWNNSDVTVFLAATDDQSASGVKQLTYAATGAQPIANTTATGGSAAFNISNEGQTAITFFATDNADNVEAPKQAAVKLDKTAPAINCGNVDGLWHAGDVNIVCNAGDGLSGLASAYDSSFTLVTSVPSGSETANALSGSHSVCDVAGNCGNAGPIGGNMVDKKPPTITISSPVAGTYVLKQVVTANYACSDGGSGIASCAGPVANGVNISTASIGSNTFTVNAIDKVGNAAVPQSVRHTVVYNVCALYDLTRAVQSGATVPIKIQLCDANRADVSSASTVLHATKLVQTSSNASETIQDSGNANPDNDFRYDSTLGPTGGYIFNLSTKGLATGTYALSFTAGADPSTHTVMFQVR